MFFRLLADWLKDSRSRRWVAALILNVAVTSSGIPCLSVCLGHCAPAPVREEEPACHDSGALASEHDHGAGEEHCPAPSCCTDDQTPADANHAAWTAPSLDALAFLPSSSAAQDAPRLDVGMSRVRSLPDRSPPIPPAFSVLRP
jgi:hypothetical protein